MKFDKELGMKRLSKFFGGIGKGINNLINKIREYQEGEEERTKLKMAKLDRQIELQKKVNQMQGLKDELKKQKNGNGSAVHETLEALKQQKIFAEESNVQPIKKTKQTTKQPSLDDGYTGMFGG